MIAAGPVDGSDDSPIVSVTTLNSIAAKKLRTWFKSGTAAGNAGDIYDNRDRGHSRLNLNHFPQMTPHQYTDAELASGADYGSQWKIISGVVFGNSSTSAGVLKGGSNARRYYSHPDGLDFLYRQYRANNLYVYPEHRDHDPGYNGLAGYGDLFPTNTPYLIASQGSSGSDQAFLRAIALVLAAFKPEVKRRLVNNGLLMPTVQMVLRANYSPGETHADYLSTPTHPTVFDGDKIDPLAMVKMAHAIEENNIPPFVRLRVEKETAVIRGKDFFDPHQSEVLANTPSVIARVFRGTEYRRQIQISAQDSFDLNNRKLQFHWIILRGDRERIRITPKSADKSSAQIEVAYHPRAIAHNGAIESNRVDIGVFAHNGRYYSAPAFVTWFSLDHESRHYADDDRILQIGYGQGTVHLTVKDWAALFDLLEPDNQSFPAQLLKGVLDHRHQAALAKLGADVNKLYYKLIEVEQDLENAGADTGGDFRRTRDTLRKQLDEFVSQEHRQLAGASIQQVVRTAFSELYSQPYLSLTHRSEFKELLKPAQQNNRRNVLEERDRLIDYGIANKNEDPSKLLSFAISRDDFTDFDKNQVKRFNSILLNELAFPGIVSFEFKINYVDPILSLRKQWRDMYRYDGDNQPLGWVRHEKGRRTEFNRDGLVILEKDELGRCLRCRIANYEFIDGKRNAQRHYPTWTPITHQLGNEVWTYQYADDDDFLGRVVKRENVDR